MGTPEQEMPSLTISLPQGWGERELASLLAPVKGVRIEVAREGGPAFIQFECEADALQARSLMRTLSKDEPAPVVPPAAASPHGSYSSWSASPVPQPEPVSSLGLCPPPAVVPAYVPTVSTTLLVSYRHSWRLVEALHGSLLDIGRGGPLQRADDILHKLEVARLQQRIDEKEATITDLRAAPEAAAAAGRGGGGGGDGPVSGDIHEQLNSAATMIQNTQKQLAEARERGRRSEQQREAHRKGEDAAKQQLTEALELHSKELARKSEQADELSTRLGAIDAIRSLEYKEIYARFEHASTEVAEWSALERENTQVVTRILAEEMQTLSGKLREGFQMEKAEVLCSTEEQQLAEKEAAELMLQHERDASAHRIVELEGQVRDLRERDGVMKMEISSLKERAKQLQDQLDDSTTQLAGHSDTFGRMLKETEEAKQQAAHERDNALRMAEAARKEREEVMREVKTSLDVERALGQQAVEGEGDLQKALEDKKHEMERVKDQYRAETEQLTTRHHDLSIRFDKALEDRSHSLAAIEDLTQKLKDEGLRSVDLSQRVTTLEAALAEAQAAAPVERIVEVPTEVVREVPVADPAAAAALRAATDDAERLRAEVAALGAEAGLWKNEAAVRGEQAREVERLEKRVGLLQDREQQLKTALRQAGVEIDQLAAALTAAQSTSVTKGSLVEALECKLDSATKSLQQVQDGTEEAAWYQAQYDTMSKEFNQCGSELRRCRSELGRCRDELRLKNEELEQTAQMHQADVAKLEDALKASKARVEKLAEEASSSRAQLQKAAESLGEAVKAQTAECTKRNEGLKHQHGEVQRLKEELASGNAQAVDLKAKLGAARRELLAEKELRTEVEAVAAAAASNYEQLKQQTGFVAAEKKAIQEELHRTRRQLEEEMAEAATRHKRMLAELDGVNLQLKLAKSEHAAAARDRTVAEEREEAARGELERASDDAEALHARLAKAKDAAAEAREAARRAQQQVVEVTARCDALQDELANQAPAPPAEPAECKQCEVYQSARRLQQEVMASMQADAAHACGEADALRMSAAELEAANARLQGEAAALRATVAESEAHAARLAGRATEGEYKRLVARLEAAEGSAATLDANARSAQRDASTLSEQLQEREADLAALRRHSEEAERQARETEAALRATVDELREAAAAQVVASYTAEHEEWAEPAILSLFSDGTFGREGKDKEGYWGMESSAPEDGTARACGVHLRLLWNGRPEEYLTSDTQGDSWVGKSMRLAIVRAVPDWLTAEVYKKGVEGAEARAASAQWKLQAAGSPRGAASPSRGGFDAPAASPGRGLAASPLPQTQPQAQRRAAENEAAPAGAASSSPVPAAAAAEGRVDPRALEALFGAEFPGVERTLISGVAHNVAEGSMPEKQARLMLADMASGDAYEDM